MLNTRTQLVKECCRRLATVAEQRSLLGGRIYGKGSSFYLCDITFWDFFDPCDIMFKSLHALMLKALMLMLKTQ